MAKYPRLTVQIVRYHHGINMLDLRKKVSNVLQSKNAGEASTFKQEFDAEKTVSGQRAVCERWVVVEEIQDRQAT